MQPEQQITQYLIENPLINAILDDDEDKVNQLINAKESRIENYHFYIKGYAVDLLGYFNLLQWIIFIRKKKEIT